MCIRDSKNYTVLCSNSDSTITQYVNQNINKYFDVILKISNGTICDEENVAVAVLNNANLTTEHKQDVYKRQVYSYGNYVCKRSS